MQALKYWSGVKGNNPRRLLGGPLSLHERVILELLCAGNRAGTKVARQPAAHARWGGQKFDDCEDYTIEIPADLTLGKIPPHPSGPFASIEVINLESLLGQLSHWAQEGNLRSADVRAFVASDQLLPAVNRLCVSSFAPWLGSGSDDE